MTKRKITPNEGNKLLELLQDAGINDVSGVQELFKEMVSSVLESGLEGELDEELGYSKYDYRNKETDNSRNGYSEKTLKSSLGDLDLAVPRDRKGEFEPQIVKKNQTTLSGDIEYERYWEAALDAPSLTRYDAAKAEDRFPAFRPIKYFALFCTNRKFTQNQGYTYNTCSTYLLTIIAQYVPSCKRY